MDDLDVLLRRIYLQRGGLIEVCVPDSSVEDWRHVVDYVHKQSMGVSLTKSGVEVKPDIYPDMFTDENFDASYALSFRIGQQSWTTAFYSATMVDFQGDPAEVDSVSAIRELVNFMKALHKLTGKRVILIPETVRPLEVQPYVEINVVT